MPQVNNPNAVAVSIGGQMKDLQAQLDDVKGADRTAPFSLTVGAGGVTDAGPLAVTGATTLAGTTATILNVTGSTSTAALSVGGFSLAALIANAVSPAANQVQTSGFALTTSYAVVASFSFTVPAGCTRALINASGSVTTVTAFSGGNDYGYALVQINGTNGPESKSIFSSGNAPSVAASSAQTLSGLTPGATIPLYIFGRLTTGPGSTPLSQAGLSATALFLP